MAMFRRLTLFFITALLIAPLGCATQSERQSASADMGQAKAVEIASAVNRVTAVKNDMRLR